MELWDVCDREGNRTGETIVRGEIDRENVYHMVCGILVEQGMEVERTVLVSEWLKRGLLG